MTLGELKVIFDSTLRNNRSSNRSGRSQIDHDVFEGLPVRHWRKASFAVSIALQQDEPTVSNARDTLFVELAMPRDSQLLPPMSQALLRAARSGEITKKAPSQPLLEDDKENGEDDEPAGDVGTGFMAKRWVAIPRHLEGPEPEFLAKRRKGLPSAYSGPLGQVNGTLPMRKTKVKKIDSDGSATVLDVLVPEGQIVDGEVVEGEAGVAQAPAPGTVVEGVGVANAEGVIVAGDQMLPTPPRRRPPPPKRKAKGVGRGRRKKVAFVPGPAGQNSAGSLAAPSGTADGPGERPDGQHEARAADGGIGTHHDHTLPNGEESSEESDEGEEGDEDDKEDGELSPSPPASKSPPTFSPLLEQPPSGILEDEGHIINGAVVEIVHRDGFEDPDPPTEKNASIPLHAPSAADKEVAAIPNMSSPFHDLVAAPRNKEQFSAVEELPDTAEQLVFDVPAAAKLAAEQKPSEAVAQTKPLDSNDHQLEEENQYSDGEIDLLGSLEKQLNSNEITEGR
ncbi:MAG: hypothetical protein Q9184_001454 [Pyrenodesmia sp. 2 TL-2023]